MLQRLKLLRLRESFAPLGAMFLLQLPISVSHFVKAAAGTAWFQDRAVCNSSMYYSLCVIEKCKKIIMKTFSCKHLTKRRCPKTTVSLLRHHSRQNNKDCSRSSDQIVASDPRCRIYGDENIAHLAIEEEEEAEGT